MKKELDGNDYAVLDKIYQKMRANRKPYIDKATLHFQHSNESCEKLRAAHLLFFYKGNDCVGLTQDGIAIAASRRARNNKIYATCVKERNFLLALLALKHELVYLCLAGGAYQVIPGEAGKAEGLKRTRSTRGDESTGLFPAIVQALLGYCAHYALRQEPPFQ